MSNQSFRHTCRLFPSLRVYTDEQIYRMYHRESYCCCVSSGAVLSSNAVVGLILFCIWGIICGGYILIHFGPKKEAVMSLYLVLNVIIVFYLFLQGVISMSVLQNKIEAHPVVQQEIREYERMLMNGGANTV